MSRNRNHVVSLNHIKVIVQPAARADQGVRY